MNRRTVLRRVAVLGFISLVAVGCVDGAKVESGSPQPGGSAVTTTTKAVDECTAAALEATEVGVTDTTITVAVIADTGSPIRPGLFQGSVDGVKAWADYRNANGGLGCRKVEVKVFDSKLSPGDAKNSVLTACTDAFALVGTTATFLNDVTPLESCPDKQGAATGLPDLAVLQTEPAHQCSAVSFAVLNTGGACPYAGSGERSFALPDGPTRYLLDHVADDLHGVFLIPKDLPSTISASIPVARATQNAGIRSDAEIGVSGLDTQSAYTPIVQTIKEAGSTYASNLIDYKGTVALRREAQIQGVDTVKAWDCTMQCYDRRLLEEGGSAVEGQYVWLRFLPFEDKGTNETLDAFLRYNQRPDGFGLQAFLAGELLNRVVDGIVSADGPNALTRAAILKGVRGVHDFDGGGVIPSIDIGAKTAATCFVMMQVRDGKFARVSPVKAGTFNCDSKLRSFNLDPLTAFKG